ncbi:putative primase [Staphylococcus gallinarum]|uniref:Putative primase n=1 Tax=Staphylococcus gallinarum TaxID=1293 RepID=A0A380FAG1_STAGA|nr:putative primase [Staphylococcus gallinarum]
MHKLRPYNGYDYWGDFAWKDYDKVTRNPPKVDNIIKFDKDQSIADTEAFYEDDLDSDWEDFDDE